MSTTSTPALTIGFDGKRALHNFTGLGNYSRFVVETMARSYPECRFVLFTSREPRDERVRYLLELPNVEVVTPRSAVWKPLRGVWRHRWGLSSAIRRAGVDLYHGLSNELPSDIHRAGVPSVVTIHDLIFRTFPGNYKAVDRRLYDMKFRSAARKATRVVAISERTRYDIERFYGVPSGRIDVIYQGCAPLFSRPTSEETRRHVAQLYRLPERYIICVGTIEQRKNQRLLAEAMAALPSDVSLVLVGRGRNGYDEELRRLCAALGVSDRVIHLQGVPTEHLPALYAMAEVAAYPSFYEGFGLPVIEALSCGVPVVAATGSCLEEAGGEGALYVDPRSPEEMADALRHLLCDDALRRRMVEAGRRHIAAFAPRHFADRLMATYRKAIKGNF